MELPLYQGSQFQPARIPQGSAPVEHPMADTWQKSAAVTTQTALNLEIAKQDRQEYILEQNRSAALQEAAHNLDMEMLQRLQLANGADNSFYDENGILIQSEVDELRQRYLSISDAWTSGFQTEHGMRAAQQAQTKYRSSVDQTIDAKLTAGLKARAQSALQSNIKASITRGDYDTPITAIDNSVKRGFTSPADAAVMKDDILSSKWDSTINTAMDADALAADADNPANADFFSSHPEYLPKIQRRIDALLKYAGKDKSAAAEEESVIATTAPVDKDGNPITSNKTSKSTTTKNKVTPAQAPVAGDGFVQLHFLKHGNNIESAEALTDAHTLFLKHVGTITDLNEEAMWKSELLAKTLHLPASVANRILADRKKTLEATISTFDVEKAHRSLKATFTASQSIAKDNAPDHTDTFDRHARAIETALQLAENDYYKWLGSNSQANEVEKARAYQKFIYNRRSQELIDTPAHGWNHMRIGEYFARFEAQADAAGRAAVKDIKQSKLYKEQLEADKKHYESIKNSPDLIRAYYGDDAAAPFIRKQINDALEYQARYVTIDTPMDNPAKAASLTDSHKELIIYTNPDPEKTSSISRLDSILVQQDGDTFRVKIVETPHVTAPTPSILLQKKLRIFGKKPNHFYFRDNILTFTQKKKTKSPIYQQSGIALPSDIMYDENGLPSLFPANPDGTPYNPLDDGLAPSI